MSPSSAQGGEARLALAAGLGCYLMWGFVPLVMQAIGARGVGAAEILAHRIVWSVPTAAIFVVMAKQLPRLVQVMRRPKVLAWLAASALLIAMNWIVFIWAVNDGRVLETSLGYYINPLINMAAGALIFRERIDRIGQAAIALALIGVVIQAAALGHAPWTSLVLAVSFAGYGVVRKQVDADAQTGLLVECLLLVPISLVFLAWLHAQGQGSFDDSPATAAWLLASGPITAIPLVLFAWAARRLPLSAMGFLQFVAPTISFTLGLLQGEEFTAARAVSFAFIWGGAAVFCYGAWRKSRAVLTAERLAKEAAGA
jgi:chloramphenicol-sensitive protein RarD